MKYLLKTVWFIQAFLIRLLPMVMLLAAHTVGEVYIYNWDPFEVLEITTLPKLFGPYLYLYVALGLLILLFFFMRLAILARVMTLGILLAQVLLFLSLWDIYIYDLPENPYPTFYKHILYAMILGFILQASWHLLYAGYRKGIYYISLKRTQRKTEKNLRKVPVKKS
ncbi:MAG TPA: hypothetical protein DEA52_06760 [Clostridiaceae bacterium]|nr:hypothetical protein [Clostridiaceae bacterium]